METQMVEVVPLDAASNRPVSPGVLASHVTAENTALARELAWEVEKLRADVARIEGLLSEIRHGVAGYMAQAPRDLAALADALMAGGPLPQATAADTAVVSRSELEVRKTALEVRRKELERQIQNRSAELKNAVIEILRHATREASNDLADQIRDRMAPLHIAVDAGHSLFAGLAKEPLPQGFRQERFLAPPLADRSKTSRIDPFSEVLLVDFASGGGLSGEIEGFRRAVKSLVGVCPL